MLGSIRKQVINAIRQFMANKCGDGDGENVQFTVTIK